MERKRKIEQEAGSVYWLPFSDLGCLVLVFNYKICDLISIYA